MREGKSVVHFPVFPRRAGTRTAYDLCAGVCQQIATNPRLFDQRALEHSVAWWLVTLYDGPHVPGQDDVEAWLDRARELLGMTDESNVPLDYIALTVAFAPAGTPRTLEYARAGIKRLRQFMAANEAELRRTRLPEMAPAPTSIHAAAL